MDKIKAAVNQFRRIYADNGKGDVDFSKQEEKLRLSQIKLTQATQDLVRASERLNNVALMGIDLDPSKPH